jgi:hypothetical protein
MDGSEALIAGGDQAFPFLFKFKEELADRTCTDIFNSELIYRFVKFFSHEGKEDYQCVPIASLRIGCEIAVSDQILQKEATDPWSQKG